MQVQIMNLVSQYGSQPELKQTIFDYDLRKRADKEQFKSDMQVFLLKIKNNNIVSLRVFNNKGELNLYQIEKLNIPELMQYYEELLDIAITKAVKNFILEDEKE